MKIKSNIKVHELPIRFFPECNQGLKASLTGRKLGLASLNDLSMHPHASANWGFGLGEYSANNLAAISLKYLNDTVTYMELDIPKKYESELDFNKFIV